VPLASHVFCAGRLFGRVEQAGKVTKERPAQRAGQKVKALRVAWCPVFVRGSGVATSSHAQVEEGERPSRPRVASSSLATNGGGLTVRTGERCKALPQDPAAGRGACGLTVSVLVLGHRS